MQSQPAHLPAEWKQYHVYLQGVEQSTTLMTTGQGLEEAPTVFLPVRMPVSQLHF